MKVYIKNEDLEPIQKALEFVAARIDTMEAEIGAIEKKPFDLNETGHRQQMIEDLQEWIRDLSHEEDILDEVLDKLRPFAQ